MPIGDPQLAAIASDLAAVTARVHAYRRHQPSVLQQRPAPASWSAIECLQHLNLTSIAYLPILDTGLAQSVPATNTRSYRAGLLGGSLRWTLEPPYRMKSRTAPAFVPGADARVSEVLDEFERLQGAVTTRVARCVGRDLEGVKVVSPFSARVTYNLYAALTILAAHQRRHLWQADRALDAVTPGGAP